MVEGALEFGGDFSIDLGVATGGVHIMAGIYFQLTGTVTPRSPASSTSAARFRSSGIISISIDLNLSLSFIHTARAIRSRAAPR